MCAGSWTIRSEGRNTIIRTQRKANASARASHTSRKQTFASVGCSAKVCVCLIIESWWLLTCVQSPKSVFCDIPPFISETCKEMVMTTINFESNFCVMDWFQFAAAPRTEHRWQRFNEDDDSCIRTWKIWNLCGKISSTSRNKAEKSTTKCKEVKQDTKCPYQTKTKTCGKTNNPKPWNLLIRNDKISTYFRCQEVYQIQTYTWKKRKWNVV